MVEMISIFREFETNHRAMTVQAETLRELIEQQLR
jgi:flagellar basal body rod protein FlgG